MNYKGYFKCPECGERIISKIENDDSLIIKPFEPPTCSGCGKQYLIIIFPDFSYEIKDIEE